MATQAVTPMPVAMAIQAVTAVTTTPVGAGHGNSA
jgi:hypothetical protein